MAPRQFSNVWSPQSPGQASNASGVASSSASSGGGSSSSGDSNITSTTSSVSGSGDGGGGGDSSKTSGDSAGRSPPPLSGLVRSDSWWRQQSAWNDGQRLKTFLDAASAHIPVVRACCGVPCVGTHNVCLSVALCNLFCCTFVRPPVCLCVLQVRHILACAHTGAVRILACLFLARVGAVSCPGPVSGRRALASTR
jgi:hypothetical protein